MSRALSVAARQAIFAQQTSSVFLMLLTFDNAEMPSPLRVVNNYENITSNGNEFIAYPFAFTLPDEETETLAQVELTISNVNRLLVESVRSIGTPLTTTLELVMAESPDTIEAGPFPMTLREVKYDALKLNGTCNFHDLLNQAYPAGTYIPSDYPGLF